MNLEFPVHLFSELNNCEKCHRHKFRSTVFFMKPYFFLAMLFFFSPDVFYSRDPHYCNKNNKEAEEPRNRTSVCLLLSKTHTFLQMFWNKHLCLCLHSN